MQIQHEAQLIESPQLKASEFVVDSQNAGLDAYTLRQTTSFQPINYLASNPVIPNLIAIYLSQTNQIALADTKKQLVLEKFSLKSYDKKFSKSSFTLNGMAFSPDGTRLSVGQSDCIIYIYKLLSSPKTNEPTETTAKKQTAIVTKPTITGRFICSSPITCLKWTDLGIIFATQDGKVKLILMSSNCTPQTSTIDTTIISVHSSVQNVMPIALTFSWPLVCISFIDLSVQISAFSDDVLNPIKESTSNRVEPVNNQRWTSNQLLCQPSVLQFDSPIYCLQLLQRNVLCCASHGGRIDLHSVSISAQSSERLVVASPLQSFDLKETLMAIDYSSANEMLAIATITRLLFLKYDQDLAAWHLEPSYIELNDKHVFSNTSVLWSSDGSHLIGTTLTGCVELFKCQWNQFTVGERFDICYSAKNRVIIRDRGSDLSVSFRSQHDIKRVNLLNQGQNVVIWTNRTLLLASIIKQKYRNEQLINPTTSTNTTQAQHLSTELSCSNIRAKFAKFCFDYPGIIMISNLITNELLLAEWGKNSVLYSVKLERINKNTLSVCSFPPERQEMLKNDVESLNSLQFQSKQQNRNHRSQLFVYLNDPNSLVVIDLTSKTKKLVRSHTEKIIWLELNFKGDKLLFRDSSLRLFLLELSGSLPDEQQETKLLCDNCYFSYWMPESSILIAQSAEKVIIWYNINELNKFETIDSRAYNLTNSKPIIDLSLTRNLKDETCKYDISDPIGYPVIKKIIHQEADGGVFLELTNGHKIRLDSIKLNFTRELNFSNPAKAFEILAKVEGNNIKKYAYLWTKLGWLSLEEGHYTLALKCFKQVEQENIVNYLERCLEQLPDDELEWRMAMLMGKWDDFEQLLQPNEVIGIYKRLNKWSRAIDYATRLQQFRQRDLLELEQREWLISQRRFLEAAELMMVSKSGPSQLDEALELLLRENSLSEAVDFLVNRRAVCGTKLIEELKFRLEEEKKFDKLALLYNQVLKQPKQAIEYYLIAKCHENALEIVRENPDTFTVERLQEIENSFGEHVIDQFSSSKISRKGALQAIEHFLAANNKKRALEAAIDPLCEFARAGELLKSLEADEDDDSFVVSKSKLIGEHLIKSFEGRGANSQEVDSVVEVFLLGKHYDKAVEFCTSQGKYDRAYAISSLYLDKKKAEENFLAIARSKTDLITNQETTPSMEDLKEAEKIYRLLGKEEEAIETYRKWGHYELMLELVKEFQPDQLESSLLRLATQLESEGKLELAEKYLLEANESTEWVGVVRMYRLAGRWADAYRVARPRCSSDRDPLLVQLAYWWAKSELTNTEEGPAAARSLLKQLNVLGQVIEFCCENKNFPFAIELCNEKEESAEEDRIEQDQYHSMMELRTEIVQRYAKHLELEGNFERAEQVLLENNQLEGVIKMYTDNEKFSTAVRLIENRLQSEGSENERQSSDLLEGLLNKTLILWANHLADQVDASSGQSRKLQRTSSYSTLDRDQIVERLQASQQLFLKANRPELAVELYKERGLWQEAAQVAQRYAPHLMESVELALDGELSDEIKPIAQRSSSGAQTNTAVHSTPPTSSSSSAASRSSAGLTSATIMGSSREIGELGTRSRGKKPSTHQRMGRKSSASDYLQNQAEFAMKSGKSLRDTKLVLGQFLDSLVDGEDSQLESQVQLAQFAESLSQLEQQLSPGRGGHISSLDWPRWLKKVLSLARSIFEQCGFGFQLALMELEEERKKKEFRSVSFFNTWNRIRNLLAAGFELGAMSEEQRESSSLFVPTSKGSRGRRKRKEEEVEVEEFTQLERYLWAAHYVTLQGALVNQLEIQLKQRQYQRRQRKSLSTQKLLVTKEEEGGEEEERKREETTRTRSLSQLLALDQIGKLRSELAAGGSKLSKTTRSNRQNRITHRQTNSTKIGDFFSLNSLEAPEAELGEQILTLSAKLSLALLANFADSSSHSMERNILNSRVALYNVGLWSLASNELDLVRFAFGRLIESSNSLQVNKAPDGKINSSKKELVSEIIKIKGGHDEEIKTHFLSETSGKKTEWNQLSEQQVLEARKWMRNDLIENQPLTDTPSGGDDVQNYSQTNFMFNSGESHSTFNSIQRLLASFDLHFAEADGSQLMTRPLPCLLCGLSVQMVGEEENDLLKLGKLADGRDCVVHSNEWKLLLKLCGKPISRMVKQSGRGNSTPPKFLKMDQQQQELTMETLDENVEFLIKLTNFTPMDE